MEYDMSYGELEVFLKQCIDQSNDKENLNQHLPEILAAITGNYEQNKQESIHDMIALWQNQIETPSQFLLGKRYIRISDFSLRMIEIFCISGLLNAMINAQVIPDTFATGFQIVSVLYSFFLNVKTLNNRERCIYMQAVAHRKKHTVFTKEDLYAWYPHEEDHACSSTWQCEFKENHKDCEMSQHNQLEKTLSSLEKKNLIVVNDDYQYTIKFKW